MIPVTRTFFPPIEDYQEYLNDIWENKWLTNNGELYRLLTNRLEDYLNVSNVIPMTNGTLPIQIALNAFANEGEVITTPFSYVATTSCIVWEKCKPVFVDIHPDFLTIDERKIEAAITDKTTVILATHVYGSPCNIDVIEEIALKHNLKVIYDAAHCFGVTYKGQSIFNYGDVSVCSFHATKLFHTGEGGALFCQDDITYNEMLFRHKFGHDGPLKYHGLGINAKMSELQAAMGLSVLPYMDEILMSRKQICNHYAERLTSEAIKLLSIRPHTKWNYSYYPVIFESEAVLLKIEKVLNHNDIYPRRYFYPSLTQLPYIENIKMPVADDLSKRVMCLPLYHNLSLENVDLICDLILKNITE